MSVQIILRQSFPLGRFHATPWRRNPFDDAFGEWPPSPWRLVRAVVARWYQWRREAIVAPDEEDLDLLVRALCDGSYQFHLPTCARKGSPLRQYHPVELEIDPPNFKSHSAVFSVPSGGLSAELRERLTGAGATEVVITESGLSVRVGKPKQKKKVQELLGQPLRDWRGLFPDPGVRSYGTSLVQDNYWCVPRGDNGAIWWFIEGSHWTDELLEALDRCLERIIYFGRSETLTHIRRTSGAAPEPNSCLRANTGPGSVRVLAPQLTASRSEIEQVTDDPRMAGRSVPLGGRMMYADLPRTQPMEEVEVVYPVRNECHLVQLAIGWSVAPEQRAVVRLTTRFRSAVIRELLRIKTGDHSATWRNAGAAVRVQLADMLGKDAEGKPLEGHRHTEFFVWWDGKVPTRLMVWRGGRPFDQDEQLAILRAASDEVSWAAAGPETDVWKIRLVPLDAAVHPPPGFDGTRGATWESLTPLVPTRHYLRGGRPRESESVPNQIRRELTQRGLIVDGGVVEVEEIGEASWVAVHVPPDSRTRRAFLGDRRGYRLHLRFSAPVAGPLRLGHSSSLGLGLFVPVH